MNSRHSDYNGCTNVPFVYQLAFLEYHEPIKDQDVEDNYNPNILEWVDANYQITIVNDDAHVNVLEQALPIQMNHKIKGIEKEKKNQERRNYDYEVWLKLFL